MKNSFFLVIPKRQNNPRRLIEFEAKSIQHWISELPAGNPGLATRLLHDFIIESNTIEMPGEFRLDALEHLGTSVHSIEDNLYSRLIKSGFPKEENAHKILDVLVSIQKEYTLGYWIVIKELTQKRIGWLQGKNVTLALQRCIKGLNSIVISHYLMGMPIPDWLWIDLHSLYRLSVKLGKASTKVAHGQNDSNHKSTPETCYKQILLLSLTEPTGLMQKEIPQVYGFIETIASLVSLHDKPIANQPVQCLVLTDEDKPPQFQAEANSPADAATLYIDFTKLNKSLEQRVRLGNPSEGRFSSMHLSQHGYEPAAELLEYLRQRWSGLELQSSALFSDRLDRYIAIGLAATHALKSQSVASNESQPEVLAQSNSDSLLSCQFEQTGVLSVGSMISFRKKENLDDQRSIGIVNRIIVNKQNRKVHFGVQLLTPVFLAVSYSLPNVARKDDQQKALLYSISEAGNTQLFIITDSFLLKEGDIVRLYSKNDDYPIELNNRRNIGLGYWQFSCEKIAEKEKLVQSKKGYDFI